MSEKTGGLRKRDVATLVLCAIFLISALGATGEHGRQRAQEFVCQANLHQWFGIFQAYIDRNNGRFFHGQSTQGWWWLTDLDEEYRDWTKVKIWFCPLAREPMMDEHGTPAVTLTTFHAWGIFSTKSVAGLGPNGVCGSYGINGYLMDIPDTASYMSGVPASEGWRDLRDVPNAASVPMFLDALRFDLWPLATDTPAATEADAWSTLTHMPRCCINRHDGTVSCLFVDGSARKVGLKELWTLKWHRAFDTAGPWTKAGGVRPEDWPAWMRPFKEY
jgi:prepilin-type processing-associated H-X9-DG protein